MTDLNIDVSVKTEDEDVMSSENVPSATRRRSAYMRAFVGKEDNTHRPGLFHDVAVVDTFDDYVTACSRVGLNESLRAADANELRDWVEHFRIRGKDVSDKVKFVYTLTRAQGVAYHLSDVANTRAHFEHERNKDILTEAQRKERNVYVMWAMLVLVLVVGPVSAVLAQQYLGFR